MQWPEQEKNAQEIERGDKGETLFDSYVRMKHFRANFAKRTTQSSSWQTQLLKQWRVKFFLATISRRRATLPPPPSPEQMAIEKVKRKCSNFLEFFDDFLHSGPIHFKKPNKFLIIVGLIEKSNHCRILRIYTYLDRASVTFYILEKPLILKEKIHRV